MITLKQPKGMRSLLALPAILLCSSVIFYSCQKSDNAVAKAGEETLTPAKTDRLLSVANVYYADNGKTAEAWFYETPLVFEFTVGTPEGERNFKLLKEAKDNKTPVNVRLAGIAENMIGSIIPATAEQTASYREAVAKQETATKVVDPANINNGTESPALVGVVPNLTVLNNIFNTLRNQGCGVFGPYLYGQCVPYQFVADGCYARAHKMRQIIESYYGYTSYKVFNYACNGSGTLSVAATLWGNNCCVRWWYHVAPYVIVQVGTAQYGYLLDPSMFSEPVGIPTWVAAQKNTGCGYNGTAQGQVYYTSNAYAPSSLNGSTCTLVPFGDNTYNAANATCAAYAPKQGCIFY